MDSAITTAPRAAESGPAGGLGPDGEPQWKGFPVRIQSFDGPLDLLLHLVRENKMDLHAIPIAAITKQYLEYLKILELLNLDLAGEYVEMASLLIRWKARSLLPVPPSGTVEDIEDPQAKLARMLIEYQKFKAAGAQLRDRYETQLAYLRPAATAVDADLRRGEVEYQEATLFDLLKAFKRIVDTVGRALPRELPGELYSVEKTMGALLDKLRMVEYLRFTDLFLGTAAVMELIVTFLAILELARQQEIRIHQSGPGGELHLYLRAAVDLGEGI